MWLDVCDAMAGVGGERLRSANLISNDAFDLAGGERHPAAAEAPKIRKARMGADRNAALLRELECTRHDLGVASMETASDVRRRNDGQHRVVIPAAIGPKTFAKIRVQVHSCHGDLRGGTMSLCCGCASITPAWCRTRNRSRR